MHHHAAVSPVMGLPAFAVLAVLAVLTGLLRVTDALAAAERAADRA